MPTIMLSLFGFFASLFLYNSPVEDQTVHAVNVLIVARSTPDADVTCISASEYDTANECQLCKCLVTRINRATALFVNATMMTLS